MRLRVLYPVDRIIESENREQFISQLAHLYGQIRGVRSNLVISQDGQTRDASGRSQGISNDVDRALLAALRRQADVVLTGGETARVEKYKKPRTARLAILTKSGELAGVPAIDDEMGPRVILLTSATAAKTLTEAFPPGSVEIRIIEERKDDPTGQIAAVAQLEHAGFESILNESGPKGIRSLSEGGLLQEICLTITKKDSQSFRLSDVGLRLLDIDDQKYVLSLLAISDDSLFTAWRKKP